MIVRTYARRSRCSGHGTATASTRSSFSEPFDDIGSSQDADFSLSQELSHDRPFNFSSQDSSPCPLPQIKKRRGTRDAVGPAAAPAAATTATLMEAQEFGEMMEHVDEVNFALDGLRPRQPARIRRASLLSLLAICGTPQRRRLLRAQGMAKRIIDAILGLKFDDSPSTVAAAALFFVLASDVQDDHLLDSPPCIQFLLKLLDPKMTNIVEDKAPAFGSKLLGILKPQVPSATNEGMDSSSRKIISEVQEILLSCKEIKLCSQNEDGVGRPELSSKWISLLTMEKACLSTVSFEDTCEPVRSVGGNFKERLRELGGLDAIFNVIVSCHSTMERWSKHKTPSVSELKDGKSLESVVLLLKCLKIMENATFLSKDNQHHLLNMKGKPNDEGLCPSFVGIVINCIRFLSGLSLLQDPASSSEKGNSNCSIDVKTCIHGSQSPMKGIRRDKQYHILTSEDVACCGIEDSHVKRTTTSNRHQKLADSPLEPSVSGFEMTFDVYSAKENADFHAFKYCDEALSGSNGGGYLKANGLRAKVNANSSKVNINTNGLKTNSGNFGKGSHGWISLRAIGSNSNSQGPFKATGLKSDSRGSFKRPRTSENIKSGSLQDGFDPFAFDEDGLEISKWEKFSRKKETSQTLRSTVTNNEHAEGCKSLSLAKDPSSSQSTNGDSQTLENKCPLVVEEDTDTIEDCLLTSVKVLMNLTNDNLVGCQQIAVCGGLDTMVTLIISHFPSFDSCSPMHSQLKEDIPSSSQSTSGQLNDKHLRDNQLDFLVAILGLLVNLVEKDSRNRLRLASAQVLVGIPGRWEGGENQRDVIPLLCSIFLANQGAGEGAGEQRLLQCDDESSLMQGEREAEKMIVEAYAALLLAFLSTESAKVREAIARCLPNHNLQALVPVLERFVAFHMTLNVISPETHSMVTKVIEACKGP